MITAEVQPLSILTRKDENLNALFVPNLRRILLLVGLVNLWTQDYFWTNIETSRILLHERRDRGIWGYVQCSYPTFGSCTPQRCNDNVPY